VGQIFRKNAEIPVVLSTILLPEEIIFLFIPLRDFNLFFPWTHSPNIFHLEKNKPDIRLPFFSLSFLFLSRKQNLDTLVFPGFL